MNPEQKRTKSFNNNRRGGFSFGNPVNQPTTQNREFGGFGGFGGFGPFPVTQDPSAQPQVVTSGGFGDFGSFPVTQDPSAQPQATFDVGFGGFGFDQGAFNQPIAASTPQPTELEAKESANKKLKPEVVPTVVKPTTATKTTVSTTNTVKTVIQSHKDASIKQYDIWKKSFCDKLINDTCYETTKRLLDNIKISNWNVRTYEKKTRIHIKPPGGGLDYFRHDIFRVTSNELSISFNDELFMNLHIQVPEIDIPALEKVEISIWNNRDVNRKVNLASLNNYNKFYTISGELEMNPDIILRMISQLIWRTFMFDPECIGMVLRTRHNVVHIPYPFEAGRGRYLGDKFTFSD